MVATNVKLETMNLMEKRSAIEVEMNSIIQILSVGGGPGIEGGLVDSEGFPRLDIDIPDVRAQRRRLSELKNDHKEITEKIDANIQILHAARVPSKSSSVKDSGKTADGVVSTTSDVVVPASPSSSMDVDVVFKLPFAMVDEITDGSPAAEDGLQLGDRIVKFGNVEAGDNNLTQKLSSEAQTNQGKAVPVVVMRQGAIINLTVTPRTWQGRGLFGCHFQML
ncbi:uncharacterized protein [Rutidosis leptorrhynchoides]|uniref:uncharacterized protein n=1 Tax=Rutidosis leptorrhynchoides TaxID=125765 RepID=UPI003A98F9BE